MIVIPVDAHLLTLTISTPEIVQRSIRVGRETSIRRERVMRTRQIPTTRNAATLATALKEANATFAAADIEFRLRNTTTDPIEAPKGADALDDEGFLMLAAKFPMNNAVSLLLVRRFAGNEGGAAVEKLGVCAVGDNSHANALPHELGHLLNLDHQGDIRDLMNPGLSVPGAQLTPTEIATAKASRLAKRFGEKA